MNGGMDWKPASVTGKACVVGAGPNGLSAAIVLAQAGFDVEVFEAEPTPGGAVRTLELTLPGFHHDFGSAVHPLAAGSPFFSRLPLEQYGLQWIHSPAVLAHPFDGGDAVMVERDFHGTSNQLGVDADAWKALLAPLASRWTDLAYEVLQPVPHLPRHAFLLARFGSQALLSAQRLSERRFRNERTRALFAGLAAHSFLGMDESLSSAPALLLGAAAHAIGWPIPRGGAQSITNALCKYLESLGGRVTTSHRVEVLPDSTAYDLVLCDVTPHQLLRLGQDQFSGIYRERLEGFRYGPGVFKVDYALHNPIPWTAPECSKAATIHIGGTFQEIAAAEAAVRKGRPAERPFVLLSQPSLYDSSRAPQGKHTAWAYCHVPSGSEFDMLERLESQIERFAPGFRDCVLARRVFTPHGLQAMDANLVGGDINGGILDLQQFLFRPSARRYATSTPGVYICSSSTPPGGGVHGMCGYNAARMAISRLRDRTTRRQAQAKLFSHAR